MKRIELTQGMVALVDDDDYDRLMACGSWHYGQGYARREFRANGKRKGVLMHRFIVGEPDGLIIDHIDGDPLNNQRANLRLCTHSQNVRNQKSPHSNSKSGVKGVYWSVARGKWQADIRVNGKTIHLGRFTELLEAAEAYNAASAKYHGEFGSPSIVT